MNRAQKKDLAIKNAAVGLFNKHGLDRVSIEDIAKQAKVSKPTIYSRYQTKEKLFIEILNGECQKQINRMFEPRSTHDLKTYLIEIIRQYILFVIDPWYVNLFKNVVAYTGRFGEIGESFLKHGPQVGMAKLEYAIQCEVNKGELSVDNIQNAAIFLVSRARGDIFFNALLNPRFKVNDDDILEQSELIANEFLSLFKPSDLITESTNNS